MKDYYKILGVSKDADQATIKKAYRNLAVQYHPDRNPGNREAEEKFKEIGEAYNTLNDPDKRKQYDFPKKSINFGSNFVDFGDFFKTDWAEIFTRSRPTQKKYNPRFRKGSNIHTEVWVSLKETAQPFNTDINVLKNVACTTCNQTGKVDNSYCPHCKGLKTVKVNTTFNFKAPAGIVHNTMLKLTGQGNCSTTGGPPGDILIIVKVRPDSIFKRIGQDVLYTHHINFIDAILGTIIKVPTLYNSTKVKVPPGTQPNSVCYIKNLGFPSTSNPKVKGNMKIRFLVNIPKDITKEQRKLLEKLRSTINS